MPLGCGRREAKNKGRVGALCFWEAAKAPGTLALPSYLSLLAIEVEVAATAALDELA